MKKAGIIKLATHLSCSAVFFQWMFISVNVYCFFLWICPNQSPWFNILTYIINQWEWTSIKYSWLKNNCRRGTGDWSASIHIHVCVFAKDKPGSVYVVLKFSHAKNRSIKMASDRQREALFTSAVTVTGGHLCVCSTRQHKLLTFMISHKQNSVKTLRNSSPDSVMKHESGYPMIKSLANVWLMCSLSTVVILCGGHRYKCK